MKKEYKWKVHFFKKKPVRGILILCVIMAVFGILIFIEKSVIFTVLALILIVYPSLKFYLPIEYKLDETGVQVSNVVNNKRYKWDYFKKVKKSNNNIILNPYKEKRFFKRKKKVVLFNVPDPEEVKEFVESRVE
ncbi:MAG: hypothetical protein FXF47_04710 [Candidatus Mcinerneyibacterium aminivorans]|uniref:PH domain-containing protein n=1 Tax=Candidatus Mcinerneyibacterium aminivorans TaxID=2703815 RepID=A0A5D0MI88_9BACT|nr:MAG: hypothetical protein FXF47_04710 [Candidatus Mcinerneyibacterium aminivorans]